MPPLFTDVGVLREGYLAKEKERDNEHLERLLLAAEGFVQRWTRRHFAPMPALVDGADTAPAVTVTRPVRPPRRGVSTFVDVPDLRELAGVTLDGAVHNDYLVDWPEQLWGVQPAMFVELSYLPTPLTLTRPARYQVAITGRFGWWPVPDEIADATYQVAARAYRRRDAAWGDQLLTQEGTAINFFRALPAEVQDTLNLVKRRRLALV